MIKLAKIAIIYSDTMRWYVLIIFLVTGLSIAGLLVISLNLDPYKATVLTKYLFFSSLFMAIWGFGTLVLNRFKLKMDWPDFYKSFRIGFIISIVIYAGYIFVSYIK